MQIIFYVIDSFQDLELELRIPICLTTLKSLFERHIN